MLRGLHRSHLHLASMSTSIKLAWSARKDVRGLPGDSVDVTWRNKLIFNAQGCTLVGVLNNAHHHHTIALEYPNSKKYLSRYHPELPSSFLCVRYSSVCDRFIAY